MLPSRAECARLARAFAVQKVYLANVLQVKPIAEAKAWIERVADKPGDNRELAQSILEKL